MPDFLLAITGTEVVPWVDEAGTDPDNHCRVNPRYGQTLLRHRCRLGETVTLQATVDGAVPLDSALAGDLFHWSSHESAHPWPMSFTVTSGTSAEATVTPMRVGHYVGSVRRQGHGRILFHLDCDQVET